MRRRIHIRTCMKQNVSNRFQYEMSVIRVKKIKEQEPQRLLLLYFLNPAAQTRFYVRQ